MKSSLSALIFVAIYCIVFLMLDWPCYAAHCQTNQNPKYRTILAVFGVYMTLCAGVLVMYARLPFKARVVLEKEPTVLQKMRQNKIINYWLPRLSLFEWFHLFVAVCVATTSFSVIYDFLIVQFKSKKSTLGVEAKAMSRAAGHWCDIMIALNLLPISKHSFISHWLKLTTNASIRFHKIAGTLLGFGIFVHFVSYLVMTAQTNTDLLKDMLLVGVSVTKLTQVGNLLGFCGGIVFLLISLTSINLARRRLYELFLICHWLFVPTFLVLAGLHSVSTIYWSLPPLSLYILDLCYRFYNRTQLYDAAVSLENGKLMRVTVDCKTRCEPGQIFHLTVPTLSQFSHPFTVAHIDTEKVSFLVKAEPGNTWTTALLSKCDQKIRVAMDGPFSADPFDLKEIDVLVCVVAGSGAAGAFAMLEEASKRQKRCYLHWTAKEDMKDSSFLEKLPMVHTSLYTTSPTIVTVGDAPKPKTIQKLEMSNIFKHEGRVGVYICGPPGFMEDALRAAQPHAVLVHCDSYQL
ncbi:hypothetical protein EDD86DRAFT_249849 [Gorgonomyces haynaldii]|nr:hypothetical protein EDD86DRAFT_249849 [Gorgonomyces haynaldii]